MLFRLMKCATGWVAPSGAALLVMSLTMSPAFGQGRYCPPSCNPLPCPQIQPSQPAPVQPAPDQPAPPTAQEPSVDPLAFGATGGGESFAAATPNVIGDGGIRGTSSAAIRASAFKIAENESPRPADRVYFDYNYFNNVNSTGVGVNRFMPGFEKSFLDGNASFGMRLPMFTDNNDGALGIAGFGDLNMIGKYALINNRDNGNLVSAGMLLALPTGRAVNIGGSSFHDAILQPFLGYIWNTTTNFYLQGFSSVAVPTDARDISIMFNDVSTGYWVYRSNQDQFLTGIIPTIEGHVNTPLNHRGLGAGGLQDSFVMTVGSHFIIRQRAMMTIGIAEPLTGPLPFNLEAIAQFGYRF